MKWMSLRDLRQTCLEGTVADSMPPESNRRRKRGNDQMKGMPWQFVLGRYGDELSRYIQRCEKVPVADGGDQEPGGPHVPDELLP